MPLPITKHTDYETGVYKLPFSSITKKDLTSYIDTYELKYLQDLLGCELAKLFIADLTGVENAPTEDRFIYIYNAFCNDETCHFERSEGIKVMLQGFMFWEYGKTLTTELAMNGAVDSSSENSTRGKQSGTKLLSNYNNSITSYTAIQEYICGNEEIYPEFKGKRKEYTSFL